MERIALTHWELSGYFPYVPQLGMMEPDLGRSITDWMPAEVPGSVHRDLQRAGWIPDPYFGMNSMQCEWVENRWWAYRTAFALSPAPGQRCHLHFAGLDYKCHIYLNGTFLLLHEGSFTPVDLDVTDHLTPGENVLLVIFESAPDEESQAGHASHTRTQKSRFSYKWDFGTRMVPVGIWDDVWLELTGSAVIRQVRLVPTVTGKGGQLLVQADCDLRPDAADCSLIAAISYHGRQVASTAVPCARNRVEAPVSSHGCNHGEQDSCAEALLTLPRVALWQPNGMGDQPLYDVQLTLTCGGRVSHTWQGRVGFRELEWVANDGASAGALPYTLRVNGRRVYIKGVNLTPFDMLIGTVTRETYRRFLRQMQAAHINLVRVNGVGLIEKECFYDLCDACGILVWQEFIQTSSSMDRTPPASPEYLALLEDTSRAALRVKRNHACLACWCGGNELTDAPHVPATLSHPNIAFLQRLVDEEDPGRMLFPASASGPVEFLDFHPAHVMHDVHGPWHYVPREHYALFNHSDSLLHGELGAEGMACTESLARFLAPKDLTVTNMRDNLVWRHHGDWWDTYFRDTALVGHLPDLDTFVRISQLFQFEGIRYALAANRRRKFQNSGSIMWAYNEPYPNVSNTSLTDYYGVPKLAWYAAWEAYAPLLMSLRYDSQVVRPGETLHLEAWLNSSLPRPQDIPWCAAAYGMDGTLLWEAGGTTLLPADSAVRAAVLDMPVTHAFPEIFLVRLTYGEGQISEYFFATQLQTPFAALVRGPGATVTWEELPTRTATLPGGEARTYRISNCGTTAALYVTPSLSGDSAFLQSMDGCPCLLPGESRVLRVTSWAEGKTWQRIRFTSVNGEKGAHAHGTQSPAHDRQFPH